MVLVVSDVRAICRSSPGRKELENQELRRVKNEEWCEEFDRSVAVDEIRFYVHFLSSPQLNNNCFLEE